MSLLPRNPGERPYFLSNPSIPAWVCSQCGEPLLEEEAVKAIQGAAEAIEKKTRKLLLAA